MQQEKVLLVYCKLRLRTIASFLDRQTQMTLTRQIYVTNNKCRILRILWKVKIYMYSL